MDLPTIILVCFLLLLVVLLLVGLAHEALRRPTTPSQPAVPSKQHDIAEAIVLRRDLLAAEKRARSDYQHIRHLTRELARYERLRDRLSLAKTADDEWAVPNLDRLGSPDFPDLRKLDADGVVRWSSIAEDQRNALACYLDQAKALAERERILRHDMPVAINTRIRTARYADGRVVEFDMDKPDTWPQEIREINGRRRPEIEQAAASLPMVDPLPQANPEALPAKAEAEDEELRP